MRVPRIYHPFPLEAGSEVELSALAAQHVGKVLRLRTAAALLLFDGKGNACRAKIIDVGRHKVRVMLQENIQEHSESPLHIHLGLGISKGERMDYAIQKAVEAGVTAITPLITEHTVVKLDERRRESRQQHWLGVIISAREQCGRSRLPVLHEVSRLDRWVENIASEHKLVFDDAGQACLGDISPAPRQVAVLIGPEGGLDAQEVSLAKRYDFLHVRLGPRILRTETAAVAIIASLQTRWGDYA